LRLWDYIRTIPQVDRDTLDAGFLTLAAVSVILPYEVANGDFARFLVWITYVVENAYSSIVTAGLCARVAVIRTTVI
jgi:hypothetical protein